MKTIFAQPIPDLERHMSTPDPVYIDPVDRALELLERAVLALETIAAKDSV